MAAEFLRLLAVSTLASSVAMVIVRLARTPLRNLVGSRAAYWSWLLVPALTAAVLLPAPSGLRLPPAITLPTQIQTAFVATAGDATPDHALNAFALAIWAIGAVAMLSAMLLRQRAFVRSLGSLRRDEHGLFRGEGVRAPMLIGAWSARILVPADFRNRYTREEQELVLAHERAHARRGDVGVNLLGSLALCVFWFNPLSYRALGWLRIDQELACDAEVLAGRSDARRCYADALLKTQLATQSAWRTPMVCTWGCHPLKERILMLKRPLPGSQRRLSGVALILGLTSAMAYTAWAGQSQAPGQGPSILVDLKVTITNPQTSEIQVLATRYVVRSGEEILDASSLPLKYACTPFLPDEAGRTTDWTAIRARGIPVPPAGQILLTCSIRRDGSEVFTPAIMVADGKPGAIEFPEGNGPRQYRIEVIASTSPGRIAEASAQSPNKN
jgi:bla regulator protein blaR1